MRIEVAIDKWEQQCCGQSFTLGDTVTWTVSAADPADTSPDAPPRYYPDHHGLIPEDVPSGTVTGHVVEIVGVTYPHVEIGAQSIAHRLDLTRPSTFSLTSVSRFIDRPLDDYLVTLEVDDDADLPAFVLGAAKTERRRQEKLTAELNRARRGDDIGLQLAALAGEVETQYATVAEITQSVDEQGCRMLPKREGATALRWARSDVADQDGIAVTTGKGTWLLEATPDGVAELRAFVAAAAEGRVHESVEQGVGRMYNLHTHVESTDRTWKSTTEYEGPDTSQGWFMVSGEMWKRVKRGDHTYAPWGDEPPRH